MFHLIQNTGKGRRASRSGKAQRISPTTWIGMVLAFLFIGSFVRFGPVLRPVRADEPTITIYKLTTVSIEKGCFADDALAIKINDKAINTSLTSNEYEIEITPGPQTISVSVPSKPNAKISKVEVGSSEENKQTYPADASGVATVQLERNLGSINVIVYLTGLCGEASDDGDKEKDISVILVSDGCKSPPQWDDVKVSVDGHAFFDAGSADDLSVKGWADSKVQYLKIKPGEHHLKVSSEAFPETTIEEVRVHRQFQGNKPDKIVPFSADASASIAVTLDGSLWKKTEKFRSVLLYIRLWGNCATPKTDPKEFGLVTVITTSGEVQTEQTEGLFVLRQKGIPHIGKASVDAKYGSGTIFKTGADGQIILESEYKHTITIENSTEVKLNSLATEAGRTQIRALIAKGKITIVRPSSSADSNTTAVQTPTATVSSAKTKYSVSYDEASKQTSVGVEEGQVEVFPENETLEPVTLAANQQVQVSDKSISTVTSYSGTLGSSISPILIYVGIGAAALVGLLIVVAGITFLSRRAKHAPVQTAYQQTGIKLEAAPAKFAAPAVATNEWRCPNPQCGKLVPANKKFCTACGTRSGVKVEATPAYVASPAASTRDQRCPNLQCGKLVPARKKFCTACGTRMI